jgi:hypothetical protein
MWVNGIPDVVYMPAYEVTSERLIQKGLNIDYSYATLRLLAFRTLSPTRSLVANLKQMIRSICVNWQHEHHQRCWRRAEQWLPCSIFAAHACLLAKHWTYRTWHSTRPFAGCAIIFEDKSKGQKRNFPKIYLSLRLIQWQSACE